jgi:hypothetical protein
MIAPRPIEGAAQSRPMTDHKGVGGADAIA